MIKPLETAILADLIARRDVESVRAALKPYHPFDIANVIPELAPDQQVAVLLALPARRQAQVFGYLDAEEQMTIVRALSRDDLGRLFADMDPDERADLCKRLPEGVREAIMPGLAAAEREDVRKLAAYSEGTVGSVMTSAYATLGADLTVAQAIAQLRREAPNRETIFDSCVVDPSRRLVGVVPLRDLLVAADEATVADLMRREVVKVAAEAARSDAVRLIRAYDLIALPVINGAGVMVGIVTIDDAMDVAERVELERVQTFGGTITLGVAIAGLEAVLAYTTKSIGWDVVAVVGLSMLACTVLGSLFGILLPFAARAIRQDPATLSSPVITSVMDLIGVFICFGIAWVFLGHLFVD